MSFSWPLRCVATDCPLSGVFLPQALVDQVGSTCQACTKPLVALDADLSALEREVIDRHPQPVARAYRRLLVCTEIDSKVKALVDTFAESLRVMALVVKSEYLESDLIDEEINQVLTRDLARPLVSSWKKLLDCAIPALAAADHTFFVSGLVEFHGRHMDSHGRRGSVSLPGKASYDSLGRRTTKKRRLGPVEALLNFRNKVAHEHGHDKQALSEAFELHHKILLDLLTGMGWWRDHVLCKWDDGAVRKLAGCEARTDLSPAPDRAQRQKLFLRAPDGREQDLYPFLVVPGGIFGDVAAGEDLLIYEQNTGRRIYYASASGHSRSTKETIDTWRRLMQRKQAELRPLQADEIDPDAILKRSAAVTRRTREVLYDTRKLLRDVYAARPALDEHISAWPSSSYPLLAIAGPAGSGKTALLNHAVGCWAAEGHAVLFLRAQLLESPRLQEALRQELGLAREVEPEDLAAHGTSPERQLIVVLDGVNEHENYAELMGSAVELASALHGSGNVRIAISFRSDIADWFLAHQDTVVLEEAAPMGQTRGFQNPFYMDRNFDVRNVYGADGKPHFECYGQKEGRMPNPFSFDASYYARRYASDPQVAEARGAAELFHHFRSVGYGRGYRSNHFGLMKHVHDNLNPLSEEPHCMQCGLPIGREPDGSYDIWINSNEEPEPRRHRSKELELLWYKFCSLRCCQEKERKLPILRSRGNAERGLFYPPLEYGLGAHGISDSPCSLVPPMGELETREMWSLFEHRRGAEFRPAFGYEDVVGGSSWFEADLSNPLLLRVFLEVHAGRPLPGELSRCILFDAWFDSLAELTGDGGAFLMDFARLCLEGERSVLDLDALHQDPRTSEVVRRTWIDSIYMQLTRQKGVLSEFHRPDRIEVAFSVESFLEYVLGRVLVEDRGGEDPEQLAEFLGGDIDGFPLLTGAVSMALERQTAECGSKFLYRFIDAGGSRAATVAGGLVGRLIVRGGGAAEVVGDLLGDPTPNDLATILESCGWLEREGRREAELELLRETIDRLPVDLEKTSQSCALLSRLADHHDASGNPGAAVRAQQQAADGLESLLGGGHDETARALHRLGALLAKVHRITEALGTLDRACGAFDAALGADSPEGAGVLFLSGRLRLEVDKPEAAVDDLERALEIRVRSHGGAHPESAELRSWLGLALARAGELEKGLETSRSALASGQQHLASSDSALGDLYANVAGCYQAAGDEDNEVRYRSLVLESHERVDGSASERAAIARSHLVAALRRTGESERDEEHLGGLLRALRADTGPATRTAFAEALVGGTESERREGMEILEDLSQSGQRPAMVRLAGLLGDDDPDPLKRARAQALLEAARSLDDSPVADT